MKKITRILFNVAVCAMLPGFAGAAGTYYNGNLYKSPQSRYGYNGGGYYKNSGATRQYGQTSQRDGYTQNNQYMRTMGTNKQIAKKTQNLNKDSGKKQGFELDAAISHELANWDFRMKNAGSELRYDNLQWNVIGGEGTYYFGNSLPMQVKVGAKYGKQFGETSMTDDDITSGALFGTRTIEVDGRTEEAVFGAPALSIGTSEGGTQMGFNVSFGLTDFFKWKNVKFTPSVGYRYFKYKLKTVNNRGISIDVLNSDTFLNCLEVQSGEIQCKPYIGFADATGNVFGFSSYAKDSDGNILVNDDGSFVIYNNTDAAQLDVGSTYYYEQTGTSHSYETQWAGPYLALDMEYVINDNNVVDAGIEFGLPIYESKGNQPYRWDWAHPTSVEDKGGLGDAYHLGLNAMWSTAITDKVMFSLGMTCDYYKVNGATAKTYLNTQYYQSALDDHEEKYAQGILSQEGEANLKELRALKSKGWTFEDKNEIESVYKTIGIRLGLDVKF